MDQPKSQASDVEPQQTPDQKTTVTQEPLRKPETIAHDLNTYNNSRDPVLQKAFARSENAFELRGRDNLAAAKDLASSEGVYLNIDSAEKADSRLGRDATDSLRSTYWENSGNSKIGTRVELRDYVAQLQLEGNQHASQGNFALSMRYQAQAEFELASVRSNGRPGSTAGMNAADAHLAKADLEGHSVGALTAQARLEAFAPSSKSEWIRDTFKTSDLRSTLESGPTEAYDRYRESTSRAIASSKGLEPSTYQMTGDEVNAFEKVFVAQQDNLQRSRGAQLLAQRMSDISVNQASPKGAEINGTAKAADAGLDKVPQKVSVAGFDSKRASDGRTIEYMKQGQDTVSFRDTGKRVSFQSGSSVGSETIQAALTVAAAKFEQISLNGTKEFRERTAREAVRMGLGDRIAGADLKATILDEQQKMALKQEQGQVLFKSQSSGLEKELPPAAIAKDQDVQTPSAQADQATALKAPSQQRIEGERAIADQPQIDRQDVESDLASGNGERMPVTLMANAKGSSRNMGGAETLPVTLMGEVGSKNRQRVAGNEELPVLLAETQDASLSSGKDQGR